MEQATKTWRATVVVFTGYRPKRESELFKCKTAATRWTSAKKAEWKGYETTAWVI